MFNPMLRNKINKGMYSLVVTGTNSFASVRCIAHVYVDLNNNWVMEYIVSGTCSSATVFTLTFQGITTKNLTNYYQTVGTVGQGGSSGYALNGEWSVGSNTLVLQYGSGVTSIKLFGRVELDSKPTFVDN